MFSNLLISRDTENLSIEPIYDYLLKNKPLVNKGIKILHNHHGKGLPTRPKKLLQ